MKAAIVNNSKVNLLWGEQVRKSSTPRSEKQKRSVERQTGSVERAFPKSKYPRVDYYYDEDSGYNYNAKLPELERLIKDIKKGKINSILTWRISRIGRNSDLMAIFVKLLRQGQLLKIYATDLRVEDNSPESIKAFQQKMIDSEKYSADLSVDVKDGLTHLVSKGNVKVGPCQHGYIWAKDTVTGFSYLKPDPTRLRKIELAMKKIIYEGFDKKDALNYLNQNLCYLSRPTYNKSAAPMPKSTWYNMLRNPFYYGKIINRIDGIQYEKMGKHQAIITKEEFEILQNKNKRKKSSCKISHELPYKPLLQTSDGLSVTAREQFHITCAKCGQKYGSKTLLDAVCKCGNSYRKGTKFYKTTSYYHASTNGSCGKSISLKSLEPSIVNQLYQLQMKQEFFDFCIKYQSLIFKEKKDEVTQTTESVQTQLGDKNDELDRLKANYNMHVKRGTEQDDLMDFWDEINKQKKEISSLEAKLKVLGNQKIEYLPLPKNPKELKKYALEQIKCASANHKTLIASAVAQKFVLDGGKISIGAESDLAFAFK